MCTSRRNYTWGTATINYTSGYTHLYVINDCRWFKPVLREMVGSKHRFSLIKFYLEYDVRNSLRWSSHIKLVIIMCRKILNALISYPRI